MTTLAISALAIYIVYLSKRLTKVEKTLNSRQSSPAPPIGVTPVSSSASAVTPSAVVSTVAPIIPANHWDSKSFVNALPKIGVIALVFGLAFFLKYAIDQGWVSISLRLGLGAAVGALLLALFYLWRDKYAHYALALAGGGLAIWYLTIFAGVQMYNVLSMNSGLIILTVVTVIGLLLAYKTKSPALVALSWAGAYLTPILLSINTHSYSLMLIYVTMATLGLLISITHTKSLKLFVLIIVGTSVNLLVGALADSTIDGYYISTLVFLIIHLCVNSFTAISIVRSQKAASLPVDEKEFGLLLGVIFAVFSIPIGVISYGQFYEYGSLIMLALASWTFLIYAFIDRLEYTKINYLLSGLGAILLSISIIWQFGNYGQVLMLYIAGLAGLIVGLVQKRVEIRAWGISVIMVGLVGACLIEYPAAAPLFLTQKFGIEILGLVGLVIAYLLFKEDQLNETEHNIHQGLQFIISGLIWFFVSWDLINFYQQYDQINQRNLSLSLWWLVYASFLLAVSSVSILKPLRKIGLFLFGLVIVKVFLYDVQSIDTVYRIISFISLGVILLVVSFVYQHNKEKIKHYLES